MFNWFVNSNWAVAIVTLSLSAIIIVPIIVFVQLPMNRERNARQDACESNNTVLTLEREVGAVGMEIRGTRFGCLITWPDGSTRLVDYEAYK